MMAIKAVTILSLLGVIALLPSVHSQANNNVVPADGFVFDGPADRPKEDPTVTDNSGAPRRFPSSPIAYERCLRSCITTTEYNPVCGTDGIQYSNPGRLQCARRCGKNVQLKYYGPCQSRGSRG